VNTCSREHSKPADNSPDPWKCARISVRGAGTEFDPIRFAPRAGRPGQPGVSFSARLGLAGRAGYLEAVKGTASMDSVASQHLPLPHRTPSGVLARRRPHRPLPLEGLLVGHQPARWLVDLESPSRQHLHYSAPS